jgi:glyoxylase-like metal-dependent hydrolase (beta-lactamase superfamily II)
MTTRYRATLLRAAEFRLDGGSMFGLIPRSVWSRTVTPDDRGRIRVQHNCLLLERLDDPPASWRGLAPKLALIEAGTGDKLAEKDRDIFALEPRSILDALAEQRCDPVDIGACVISHLHFDHAGGLTRLCRPGEAPDWTGPGSTFGSSRGDLSVKRTFPNARVFSQRREWLDALANRSVMTRTYFPDHLQPIRDQLELIDSPPPHAPGLTPDRDQPPLLPQHARETEILPGLFVFRVPGHTWGQQATRFTDERGRDIVFTPDVLPTAWHLGQAYSLGYDVEPYTSMVTRGWLLNEAADRRWTLCLDHEPGHPFKSVTRNAKGWFDLADA